MMLQHHVLLSCVSIKHKSFCDAGAQVVVHRYRGKGQPDSIQAPGNERNVGIKRRVLSCWECNEGVLIWLGRLRLRRTRLHP